MFYNDLPKGNKSKSIRFSIEDVVTNLTFNKQTAVNKLQDFIENTFGHIAVNAENIDEENFINMYNPNEQQFTEFTRLRSDIESQKRNLNSYMNFATDEERETIEFASQLKAGVPFNIENSVYKKAINMYNEMLGDNDYIAIMPNHSTTYIPYFHEIGALGHTWNNEKIERLKKLIPNARTSSFVIGKNKGVLVHRNYINQIFPALLEHNCKIYSVNSKNNWKTNDVGDTGAIFFGGKGGDMRDLLLKCNRIYHDVSKRIPKEAIVTAVSFDGYDSFFNMYSSIENEQLTPYTINNEEGVMKQAKQIIEHNEETNKIHSAAAKSRINTINPANEHIYFFDEETKEYYAPADGNTRTELYNKLFLDDDDKSDKLSITPMAVPGLGVGAFVSINNDDNRSCFILNYYGTDDKYSNDYKNNPIAIATDIISIGDSTRDSIEIPTNDNRYYAINCKGEDKYELYFNNKTVNLNREQAIELYTILKDYGNFCAKYRINNGRISNEENHKIINAYNALKEFGLEYDIKELWKPYIDFNNYE